MDVEVRHLLARVHADIGEQSVARLDQPMVPRHLADRTHEAGDLLGGPALRKIVPGDVGAFGDDEDVDGCRRVDVEEGERMLVLMDALRRNLAAQDPGEDVAVVIRAGGVDRHRRGPSRSDKAIAGPAYAI